MSLRYFSSSSLLSVTNTSCNCGSIQEARNKTVEFPRIQNRGISRGNSTESSMFLSLWNFLWKFHGFVSVEFSVEFPQKIPQFCLCGTFFGNSTVLSLWNFPWNFHRRFHSFVSVELSMEILRFSFRGDSTVLLDTAAMVLLIYILWRHYTHDHGIPLFE